MPITQTSVTGQIVLPDGSNYVNASVRFSLSSSEMEGDIIVDGEPVIAPLAADGTFAVDLWPNDQGDGTTFYKVERVISEEFEERATVLGNVYVYTGAAMTIGDLDPLQRDYVFIDYGSVAEAPTQTTSYGGV